MSFSGISVIPIGNAQLSCGSATISKLSAIPSGANAALIRAETANVRWSDSPNATLTGSAGILMVASVTGTVGDAPLEYIGTLPNLSFIPVGGTGAVVNLNYYKVFT
jgi:hypothetical protein